MRHDGFAARLFGAASACFATFMTTFAVTLNNHTVAAISLTIGLAAIVPIFALPAALCFALACRSYATDMRLATGVVEGRP